MHTIGAVLLSFALFSTAPTQAQPIPRTCLSNAWDQATSMYVDKTNCKDTNSCGSCALQEASSSDGDDMQIGPYGIAVFSCTIADEKSAPIYYYVGKLGAQRSDATCPLRLFLDSVKPK